MEANKTQKGNLWVACSVFAMLWFAPLLQAQVRLGSVTDIDGNTYRTLILDSVEWMIDNLKVKRYYDTGDSIAYDPKPQTSSADDWKAYYKYPNGDSANVANYGLLYSWGAAFDENKGVPIPKAIGPNSDWTVPSIDDWTAIRNLPDSFDVQLAGDCNTTGYTLFSQQMRCWTPSLVMPGSGAGAIYMFVDASSPDAVGQGQYRNVNTVSIRCIRRFSPGPGTQVVEIKSIAGNTLQESIRLLYSGPLSDIGTLIVHGGDLATADFTFLKDSINNAVSIQLTDSTTTGGASYTLPTSTFAYSDYLQTVVLPADLTTIGASAFANCYRLTSADLYNTRVTAIGASAFSSCSLLKYIGLPESLANIGASAFADCSILDLIELPANVESIGASAFAGCNSLRYVASFKTSEPYIESTSFPSGLPLYVPSGYVSEYYNTWGDYFTGIVGITDVLDSLDTSIYRVYPYNSNAKGSSFPIGNNAISDTTAIRVLLKFLDWPEVASFDSISVSLFAVSSMQPPYDPLTISLHRVDSTKTWTEGTSNADSSPGTGVHATDNDATWFNYRYLTTDSTTFVWTTPGGDYEASASASLSFSGGVAGGRYLVISGGTLKNDATLWMASPSGNNGWIAIGNEDVLSSRVVVHSREAALAPFYRPRIRIFTNE